jgi:hypothetical protein
MNDAFEALNHVQKAISLLGEHLVTLTAHHGIDAARSGFSGRAAQAPRGRSSTGSFAPMNFWPFVLVYLATCGLWFLALSSIAHKDPAF